MPGLVPGIHALLSLGKQRRRWRGKHSVRTDHRPSHGERRSFRGSKTRGSRRRSQNNRRYDEPCIRKTRFQRQKFEGQLAVSESQWGNPSTTINSCPCEQWLQQPCSLFVAARFKLESQ